MQDKVARGPLSRVPGVYNFPEAATAEVADGASEYTPGEAAGTDTAGPTVASNARAMATQECMMKNEKCMDLAYYQCYLANGGKLSKLGRQQRASGGIYVVKLETSLNLLSCTATT
ncbi:hypothetical protein BC835DRAFT_1307201 [Cytidiella melzeri]|nr:hypothetical protein BC835DRAFT_1307201 [Cytidiella melzeri]